MNENGIKKSVNIRDECYIFWGSSNYERNGSRAKLKWRPLLIALI